MDQTSAANTRKQSSGKSVGGQQSYNEAGGNKGTRTHGKNAGQEKKQNQANSGSQGGGQTKQTQNQQQQQSTSKQEPTGKAESSKAMPAASNWDFFQSMKPKVVEPTPKPNTGVPSQQKNRNPAGKQGSQDKYAEFNKGNKSNDGANTAKNRQNGKGQQNKPGGGKNPADSYDDPEDSANAKGKGQGKPHSNDFGNGDPAIMQTDTSTKSRGRELEKYSFNGPATDMTLEDSGKGANEPYNQFAGRNPSTYSWQQYSTSLDESKLSAETIAKGKKLEAEIEGTTAKNRHLAEERGQMPQKDDVDEEKRYGEAHRGATGTFNKLDGLRAGIVTAPKGKFKGFQKKIDRNGLDNMTAKFFKNLTQKDVNSAFLAPNSQQSASSVQVKPVQNQNRMMQNPVMQQPKFPVQKPSMPIQQPAQQQPPKQQPAQQQPAKQQAPQQPPPKQTPKPDVVQPTTVQQPKVAEPVAANPFAGAKMSTFEFKPNPTPASNPMRQPPTQTFVAPTVSTASNNLVNSQPFKPSMPGPSNPATTFIPKPYNPPMHQQQQQFQPHMQQQNNFQNQGNNQFQQNSYQGNFQGNNYQRNNYNNNQGNYGSRYNPNQMPLPPGPHGQQPNMMPQQQPMQNQGYPGQQFGNGPQSFQQKAQQMPMPTSNQMPPPNSTPQSMGQLPPPQSKPAPQQQQQQDQQQNEAKSAAPAAPAENPFAAFAKTSAFKPGGVFSAVMEFKPGGEFKPK